MWKPRPPQSGQAPAGALNEKSRGSMSGKLISQTGQTYFSVSSLSGIPSETSSTKPSESLSAISTSFAEAAKRLSLAHLHAVDEALYRMAALFVELDRLFEPVERAVDARAHVALLVQLQQQVLVFALLRLDDRRVYLKRLSVIFFENEVYYLVDAVAVDLASAFRTVRRSRAAEEQAQIVVYLRDCADGRTRVVARPLLLY